MNHPSSTVFLKKSYLFKLASPHMFPLLVHMSPVLALLSTNLALSLSITGLLSLKASHFLS